MSLAVGVLTSPPSALREQQQPIYNRLCSMRLGEALHVGLHDCQPLRIGQELVDLVGENGQVVATDCRALFEQVVGIALFLSGYRIDNDEYQPFGQRLGGSQAARLADQEVGS